MVKVMDKFLFIFPLILFLIALNGFIFQSCISSSDFQLAYLNCLSGMITTSPPPVCRTNLFYMVSLISQAVITVCDIVCANNQYCGRTSNRRYL